MMTNFIIDDKIKKFLISAIEEDLNGKDITTSCIVDKKSKSYAEIIFKQKGVLAGIDIAEFILKQLDSGIKINKLKKDGDIVEADETAVEIIGSSQAILSAERLMLNFLQRLSGIATMTKSFVDMVSDLDVKILDTRKTTPNLRVFERYAVRMGGGVNHRQGLFDQVLIKENHLKQIHMQHPELLYEDVVKQAVKRARKSVNKNIVIEIEVENIDEAFAAFEAGPDIIMFDNMNPADIKHCIKKFQT
ncbi:carboxylating nicotinate-nucleotide diphosphorylase, partial [bacterium]|nr:carboxylating nicotinate-nucleotide diphosphorylase [bacterium]